MAYKLTPEQLGTLYMNQLKQLVPGINQSTNSMREVLEKALKYIVQLENSLICQIRIQGYPEDLKDYSPNLAEDRKSIEQALDNYIFYNLTY